MHLAIVVIIAAAVVATAALPSAVTGRASSVEETLAARPQPVSRPVALPALQPRSVIDVQSQSAATDTILLAALALESSDTPEEFNQSIQRIYALELPQIAAVEAAAPDPEPECVATANPAFCVYTVVEGDTLSTIAQRLGFQGNASISAAEMLAQSNKPDVVSSDHIEPGQNLRIPYETGIIHLVLRAETLGEVAGRYGVGIDDILYSAYNTISPERTLFIGQEIFIPNPAQLPSNVAVEPPVLEEAAPSAPTGEEPVDSDPEALGTVEATPAEEVSPEETAEPVEQPPEPTPTPEIEDTLEPQAEETQAPPEPTGEPSSGAPGSYFIWPIVGPISSYFGPSHPLGIDIDLYADPNAPIVAARGGTVVFAGGDPCCSYGLYVIIDHDNGLQTLYAHFEAIGVVEGQEVAQGQIIGIAGRTGYSTGNHLHFELHFDGAILDPLLYLP